MSEDFRLVTRVEFASGDEGGLLTVHVESYRDEKFLLLALDPEAELTVDGARVDGPTLLGLLLSRRYWMRAYPEVARYDAAVKAEFKKVRSDS